MLESKTAPGLRFEAERLGPHTFTEDNRLLYRMLKILWKLESDCMLQGTSIVAPDCVTPNTVR